METEGCRILNAVVKGFRLDYAPSHDLFTLTLKLDVMGKKGTFRMTESSDKFGGAVKRLAETLSGESLDGGCLDLGLFFKGLPMRIAFLPEGGAMVGCFVRDSFADIGEIDMLNEEV